MTASTRPVRHLTFYTKPGCHLCEAVEELLEDLSHTYDLHVTAVDITSDLAIFERYKYDIPVIDVAAGMTVSGRIDAQLLRRALDAAGERQP